MERAYALQLARQGKPNNLLTSSKIDRPCTPDAEGSQILHNAMNRLNWSAGSYHRILKVVRSLADLTQSEPIQPRHIAEAISYRRALIEH